MPRTLCPNAHARPEKHTPGQPKLTQEWNEQEQRVAWTGSPTMDDILRAACQLTRIPLHEVVRMATLTPARALGLDRHKGVLAPGHDADLVLFDQDINIKYVAARGETLRDER